MVCAHQSWLRVHLDQNSFVLQYGNRLDNITRSLPHPTRQYPSLIFFVGKQSKARAVQALFPGNTISRCRNHGIANICLDPATLNDEYPVLLADSTPDHAQTNFRGKVACHEVINYPLSWSDSESNLASKDLVDRIYARIFSLFIDVLCIFAQDYSGLDAVAERLAVWTAIGSASSLPGSVRPRLLIVTSISGVDFNSEALSFRLRVLSDPKFSASFSSLHVVNVLGSTRSPSREQFSGLGMVLRDETSTARAERITAHTLFSMIHITGFFDIALRNFATSPQHAFDFIVSTRESNPVPANFQQHLTSFMRLASKHKLPQNILWDFIASAIILDSSPPDMHCKWARRQTHRYANHSRVFNPSDVFRAFYRHACLLGIEEFAESLQLSSELICADIEACLISMFSQIKYDGQSAAALRQQSLERNSQHWQLLQSNVDCFICLQRKPEHIMECGHTICDMCVSNSIFSKPTKGREYYYDISTCPQCQTNIYFQARVLPPTCRVRFLGIDGGGSRGVVSLAFMERLERALDLSYPVQEHFDFAVGTSSGELLIGGQYLV